ncbi:UPF0488 protein CG14286-like [Physella acuta]|uniref:UPF0488 protein CG14286-like n=1 Tax=Physella acuta TaxID=109671 RepID=UPI0027DB4810|nr:UPF0488 protein CG14286-like [Physella acuta]
MENSSEEAKKFVEELQWCITELEIGLQRQSPDSKQVAETIKILKILNSTKAPMVKKRQAMRNALGDYRKKMKEAEAKSLSGLRHSRFQPLGNKIHRKSKFLKQSHAKQQFLANSQLESNLNNLTLSSTTQQNGATPITNHDTENSNPHTIEVMNASDSDTRVTNDSSAACCSKSLHDSFKFLPSDNSFSFGFESEPQSASASGNSNEVGAGPESLQSLCNKSFGGVKLECDNKTGVRNYYKFTNSSNEFTFGF